MHTPRYIYREGKGIFRREDLRRTLRGAAVTSLRGSETGEGGREGVAWESISRCRTVSYTHVKVSRIPLYSIYRRCRVKNLRRCANIHRAHGGRIFPLPARRGIYGRSFGDQQFRRGLPGPRAKEHNPSTAEKRASRARDASSQLPPTRAFDNRFGH